MSEGQYHSKIEEEFVTFLHNHGYPKDAILAQPALMNREGYGTYRPDFLIIDPKKNEQLAIVEIKVSTIISNKFRISFFPTAGLWGINGFLSSLLRPQHIKLRIHSSYTLLTSRKI